MAEKKFSWFFQFSGAGRHAMSATTKMMILGGEGDGVGDDKIYFIIQVLSGLETHRSNEWEVHHDSWAAIHAARD